jgi:hypothetical protein
VFKGSVRHNLDPEGAKGDEDLIEALRWVGSQVLGDGTREVVIVIIIIVILLVIVITIMYPSPRHSNFKSVSPSHPLIGTKPCRTRQESAAVGRRGDVTGRGGGGAVGGRESPARHGQGHREGRQSHGKWIGAIVSESWRLARMVLAHYRHHPPPPPPPHRHHHQHYHDIIHQQQHQHHHFHHHHHRPDQ